MSRSRFAASLVSDPGSVLDVGCRDGELSKYVSGPYAGADLFPGPKVKYVGDISALDIQDKFDTVFALDILEHLPHPSAVFDKLANVARRGMVISLPNMYDLKSRIKFAAGKPLGGKYIFTEEEPLDRHHWLMTRGEIQSFFKAKADKHGFDLSVHDMHYGEGGSPLGKLMSSVLSPGLTVATVFGVFTR